MSSPSPSSTRRRFLRASLCAGIAPAIIGSRTGAAPPNSRLAHAAIGTGNQGHSNLRALAKHPSLEVVALCDVDSNYLAAAATLFPEARTYSDYRELLAVEGDKIDSVNIATPDHMHAPIGLAAMAEGKHVYCQKPLTHNLAEACEMRIAAEQAGVVTQMGNQIQSFSEYRTAVRWVQEGTIGKIKEIHAWCGSAYTNDGTVPSGAPVPGSLDWDLWLGVAPERAYGGGTYHPRDWRHWRDFGGGVLGDFGCHILDTPFKATGLRAPLSVRATVEPEWATSPARMAETFPAWEKVEFEFAGTEMTAGDITVTWYDGVVQTPVIGLLNFAEGGQQQPPSSGALFIGEEGQLLLPHYSMPQLLPREKMQGRDLPIEKQGNHYRAFVDACIGKGETGSHFSYAGPLTETVHLGTIAAHHHGKSLTWDPAEMAFPNCREAEALLGREERAGW